jgi:hypothetical protein
MPRLSSNKDECQCKKALYTKTEPPQCGMN